MHNEKEQEMTSPVSHSEDAQSAMQGKNWGMVTLCAPTIEGPIRAQETWASSVLLESHRKDRSPGLYRMKPEAAG